MQSLSRSWVALAARPFAGVLLLAALTACGGGGGGSSGEDPDAGGGDPPAVSVGGSFPVGLSVGTPADLASAAVAAGRAAPMARRRASGLGDDAALIEAVLNGDTTVSLATVLDLEALFGRAAVNASCYGPSVAYASHQDSAGGTGSGLLPTGDLGLWVATESASGEPCAVAQVDRRVDSARDQGRQALLVAALMRGVVARSATLAMPAAGASLDLGSELGTALSTALGASAPTVAVASLALDSAGSVYSYRLVLTDGSGASARRGELILRHVPGSADTVYRGSLQVSGFSLDLDAAFGCTDEVDSASGRFKVARVSTLVYQRDGSRLAFGSRSAHYCGHPDGTASDDGAQVAALQSDGQLDPSVGLATGVRGGVLGWRGNFTRYAADYDADTGAGDFLLAWQAGTGDSHARALAAHAGVDGAGALTLEAWYAYAADIASTTGDLLGMICNWAGPGNSHVPVLAFQSQRASLAAGAGSFTLDSSLIAYAPTQSCSSTTTAYDADADGVLAAGEGVGVASALDVPGGGRTTVAAELVSRGYTAPGRF